MATAGAVTAYAATRARRGRPASVGVAVGVASAVVATDVREPRQPSSPQPEPVRPEPVQPEPVQPEPVQPVERTDPDPAPEPEPAPQPEPPVVDRAEPEPDDRDLEPDDRDLPSEPSTREALAGFYFGLVCMLFAPVLYFAAARWLAEDQVSQLAPFVLVLLAVPAVLVALPRTRRFGAYMLLGLALTGVVVSVTAVAVLWFLLESGA
ncbi:hypothetical protein RDV89_12330 [Nocardioides zeae]|uniref:Uncharacterized protein n=1 Tax=Nocardioides imazamoxiresistens TaxID=3231893 RepID=A0ABU3PXA1_9ACTN|nr:hypothetical protein [Nocardioides zeae]MDT9593861.1 hypothetical protein [Nocardioides zeae]